MHAAIAFNFFNAMTWQVALGTPMVLFAEKLGASAAAVGLAYSFVFVLTPIQVLSTAFLPRYGFKGMMLSGWGARSLFLLPPVALAWMNPGPGSGMVWIFIGSLFLFTFFRSIGACAWQPWMNALLNESNRGRYFSLEQVASGIAGVGTLLVCWYSLRVMPLHQAFLLQYGFAFIGSWLAYYALSRLPDAPRPSALPLATVVRESPRIVAQPGPFRRYLVIGVVNGVAISAIPPFCAYYLKVVPQLSASAVVGFTLLQYLGVICGAFSIRNHVDRLGSKPFFALALVIYILVATFWIGVLRGWTDGLVPIGVAYFGVGVAASCWASAANKYLPLVVGTENRTLAFSVQGAVTAVVSGFSPAIWGLFIKGHTDAPSVDVVAFQVFFAVTIACALFVMVRVVRLPSNARVGADRALFGGVNLRAFRGFTYLASLVLPAASEPASKDGKKAEDA
ncbi:MAG: hypothetical protein IAE82_18155 [Opitutaceae bacterium]|nr:hypothetical protein [Opitutaceae bacterium]